MFNLKETPTTVKMVIEYKSCKSIAFYIPLHNNSFKSVAKTELLGLKGARFQGRAFKNVHRFVCDDIGGERNIREEKIALMDEFGYYREEFGRKGKEFTKDRLMRRLASDFTIEMIDSVWEEQSSSDYD